MTTGTPAAPAFRFTKADRFGREADDAVRPMRVLIDVMELSRLGGIEVNLLEDVRVLSARGHDVHVAFGPLTYGTGDLREPLTEAGATLHGPYTLSWDLRRTPRCLAAYRPGRALVARLRPDVLWLQRFEHAAWAVTVTRRSRTPVVCHLHQAPNYGPRLQSLFARPMSAFLAVSEFTRRQWLDNGLSPHRATTVYNAVAAEDYPFGDDVEARQARHALGLKPDAPIALYYGRLAVDKGIDVVLDAWDRLDGAPEQPHLLLVGSAIPAPGPDVEAQIDRLVRAGRATRLPAQADMRPLLHAADVVLFPSRLPEAFGRVPVEAMMSGRPVVASRVGAVPEVVSEDVGTTVPPGDPEAMAEAIARLITWRLDDPSLGRRCRQHAADRFPLDARVDTIERALTVASTRRDGAPRRDTR